MKMSWRVLVAFLLGVGAFFLLFLLGEGVDISPSVRGYQYFSALIFFGGMGAYFLISEYFLSRGHQQAVRKDWPIILALNAPLILATIIASFVEQNKSSLWQTGGAVVVGVVCSYAGAALAARNAAPTGS
jgi:hypothetical protein